MTNYEAVIEVIYNERSNRLSTASATRLVKALKQLSLTQAEIIAVLYRMESRGVRKSSGFGNG
jgi:DNA-binding MarR family transcriptional regulator